MGFMGAGKSTYGKRLANAMGYKSLDLDALIEEKSGKTIAEIFETQGEEGFRALEAEVLRSTETEENVVIATGGGTACFHENMDWMNANGLTIYLRLFESILQKRLERAQEERPLLSGMDDAERHNYVHQTLNTRSVFYTEATWVIQPEQFGYKKMAEVLQAEYA